VANGRAYKVLYQRLSTEEGLKESKIYIGWLWSVRGKTRDLTSTKFSSLRMKQSISWIQESDVREALKRIEGCKVMP
jgi:hypothetical protein